ncbi:MAG: DNA recombination protein RmuC, partial [Methylotenera sp.]
MKETLILIVSACILLLLLWRFWRDSQVDKNLLILQQLEEKHRAMLLDFNDGLNKLGDRLSAASLEMNERL